MNTRQRSTARAGPSASAKRSRPAPATWMSSPATLTGMPGGRARAAGWSASPARPCPRRLKSNSRRTTASTSALDPGDPAVRRLFAALGLYTPGGAPLGEMAGKVQQVQHFIELLRPLQVLRDRTGSVRVVDAGCGKAYLSLSLALWARSNERAVVLDAVDSSGDVVATVARIAAAAELADVRTHGQSIAEFAAAASAPVDLVVSLHACDAATDEGLAAGVMLDAGAIVLVPCCHQELSDQMEASVKGGFATATDGWQAVIRHGLFQHRLADIITDSLRAAALEALGYRVAVIELRIA